MNHRIFMTSGFSAYHPPGMPSARQGRTPVPRSRETRLPYGTLREQDWTHLSPVTCPLL
ncbi:hypothetical protein [Anabaena azotica]|uniref:Uncharacterized protein n=1 Tax=Anabaena azotica FACHB-119 TaxID=947527 RepID=A0ABR8D1S1_9NOST|nr:hypothetical protein [Anabaena azotica]MBD2501077.1 hypothetical protein [Anabaena azotica FACHB-119]